MAKEFKNYDKIFRNQLHRIVRNLHNEGSLDKDYCQSVFQDGWHLIPKMWDQAYVQECVYNSEDSDDWQLLRVSMKGLTTYQKLRVLLRYHGESGVADEELRRKYICRIDNYLGALRRGGQLDSNYRVLK